MSRIDRLAEISRIMSRLTRDLHTSTLDEWPEQELTHPQFKTLVRLRHEPARMSDIAASLGTSLSAATSMIDRLEKKGLVERWHEREDRRVVICSLTTAGEEAIDQMYRVSDAGMKQLVSVLTDDELDQIVRAMRLLETAVKRLQEPAPDS